MRSPRRVLSVRGQIHNFLIFVTVGAVFLSSSASGQYKDDPCPNAKEGDLRLRGTESDNAGRVEICHDKVWGVVCANNWRRQEAKVVCRQLGYSVHESTYVQLTPEVLNVWVRGKNYTRPDRRTKRWLDNVYCRGNENFLVDCGSRGHQSKRFGRVSCRDASQRSAGVVCKGVRSRPSGTSVITTSADPGAPKPSIQKSPTLVISTTTGRSETAEVAIPRTEPSQRTTDLPDTHPANSTTLPNLSGLNKSIKSSSPSSQSTTAKSDNSSSYLLPFIIVTVVAILLSLCLCLLLRSVRKLRGANKQSNLQLALAEEKNRRLISMTEREQPTGSSISNIADNYNDLSFTEQVHRQTTTKVHAQHSDQASRPTAKRRATTSSINQQKAAPANRPRSTVAVTYSHNYEVPTQDMQSSIGASKKDDNYEDDGDDSCSKLKSLFDTTAGHMPSDDPEYAYATRGSSTKEKDGDQGYACPYATPGQSTDKPNDGQGSPHAVPQSTTDVPRENASTVSAGVVYRLPTNHRSLSMSEHRNSRYENILDVSQMREDDNDEEEEQPVIPPKSYEEPFLNDQ